MAAFLAQPVSASSIDPPKNADCQTNEVLITMPNNNLKICNFTFTTEIRIVHNYPESHTYRVEFLTEVGAFSYLDDGTLQNVTYTPQPSGLIKVAGDLVSVVVPPLPPNDATVTTHTLTFNRDGSFAIAKYFTIEVKDLDCNPVYIEEETLVFFTDPFVDLRHVSATLLSDLLAQQIISPFGGDGSLPNLLIDDELVIDVPASFIGDPNIFRDVTFMPGASIRIASENPGAGLQPNLFALFTNFHTCPGADLAEGIVVDPRGAAGIPLTKLNMTNSTIQDCRFGIRAKPNSSLRLENNDFVNNYIGIKLDMAGAATGQERVRIDGFTGNSFLTDGALKPAHKGMTEALETRGYAGIWLNKYLDFNVFGSTLSGGNSFSMLANGIIAYNSTGNLGNMTFDDIQSAGTPVYPLKGYGIYLTGKGSGPRWFNINEFWTNMTFNNCKTGIYSASHALNVENVTMTNVDVGIDLSRSQTRDIVIDGNTITASKVGVRSFLNEPVHDISVINNNNVTITGLASGTAPVSGIEMEEGGLSGTSGRGWLLTRNTITTQKGGNGISYRNGLFGDVIGNTVNNSGTVPGGPYKGIRVLGAGFTEVNFNDVTQSTSTAGTSSSHAIYSAAGFANGFDCNCVANTGVGMQFYDMADYTNTVRGNNINDHGDTGLQLGDDVQGNVFIGTQYHTGNRWNLALIPPSGFGGVHWGGSPQIISASKFFVDPNEQGGALSPTVDPDEWFQKDPTPEQSYSCINACIPPAAITPFSGEGDVPTLLDQMIASGALPTDGWANETNWKGAYRLYRKMLRRPAIENYGAPYAIFKAANTNLSTGKMAYIAEQKSKLFDMTGTEYTNLENYRVTVRQQMANILALDIQLQEGDTINESAYNSLLLQRSDTQVQYDQYSAGLKTARQQTIQSLLQFNAGASTTGSVPAANHKTLNGIVLTMLANDGEWAPADIAAITLIAEQCPLEGGDAVYEARAVIVHLSGQEFDDYELCNTGQRNARERDGNISREGDISVFPNPTTGIVYLSTPDRALVRVFNNIGQLQLQSEVTDGRLDISQLQQGMYRLQIFREGQLPVIESVVISKR